ncbi:MAG: hypothetical protein JNK91_16275 [Ferruginibacter sp.]|nr:hypothetical protein [Ferruginibacter sp.]
MQPIQDNILRTLSYFDLFRYPLTSGEICFFSQTEEPASVIGQQLEQLVLQGLVYRLDDFYSLQDNAQLAERRRKGNMRAREEMAHAAKAARILFRFPFVKGLALSGSLSKNYADEHTDIDFFIITETNRLWIARTLMHVFYKMARLVGRHRWFCMNYYIDEAAMEIEEKNIFTAVEIITLIPMKGEEQINRFKQQNRWTRKFFPGFRVEPAEDTRIKYGLLRRWMERLFSGRIGDRVDNWLMRLTQRRWLRKRDSANMNAKGVCMGMLASKHFAKPDPRHFQYRILQQYEIRVEQLLQRSEQEPALAR